MLKYTNKFHSRTLFDIFLVSLPVRDLYIRLAKKFQVVPIRYKCTNIRL